MICTACKQNRESKDFYARKDCSSGINKRCKFCVTKSGLSYKAKRQTKLVGHCKLIANSVKGGAKIRGIEHSITYKDILFCYIKQKGLCALSSVRMTFPPGRKLTNISIDRIDNTKHYTKDNIQLVCRILNIMKHTLPMEDFVEWCRKVIVCQSGSLLGIPTSVTEV